LLIDIIRADSVTTTAISSFSSVTWANNVS